MTSKQHLRSLEDVVRNLDKALVTLSALEEIQRTGAASHCAGLSKESADLLSRSPIQLSQAIVSARTAAQQATAALHTLVAMKLVRECIDWSALDGAYPRPTEGDIRRPSDSGLPRTAAVAYWQSRWKSAEGLQEQFKNALSKVVECRVRAAFVNDLVTHRTPRLTSDLPGDLVTLESADSLRLAQIARGCGKDLLNAESLLAELVCRTAQRSPHALAFFDEVIDAAGAQASGEIEVPYRVDALRQAVLLYRQARAMPAGLREAAWSGIFSFRGRCSRKHWWLADIGWLAAAVVTFIGLGLTIRSNAVSSSNQDGFIESNVSPNPTLGAYVWLVAWLTVIALRFVSVLSIDVRRLRDLGLSPSWVWLRFTPVLLLLSLAPFLSRSNAGIAAAIAALVVEIARRIVLGLFPGEPVIRSVWRSTERRPITRRDARRNAAETAVQAELEDQAILQRWRARNGPALSLNEPPPLE